MMKYQNATNKMTDCYTNLTLRSKFKVKGHQQWYATHRLEVVYLHAKYEKPILNDKKVTVRTRFVRCRDRFDLEVKIKGQRSPTMVRDTLSGGGLPTCQTWKACLERQKSYSSDTICYGRTDQFDLEVKVQGHQQCYATHRLEGVYLHAKYEKPVLNDKKVTARTRFAMDARTTNTSSGGGLPTCQICKACFERQKSYGRTHRLITIGHPPLCCGALIKSKWGRS